MKTNFKKKAGVLLFLCNSLISSAQLPDGPYFGQESPGNIATIFGPDVISLTNRKELKITFSSDSTECFYGIAANDTFRLLYTSINGNSWTDPVQIRFENTSFEREPMIAPQTNKLFFAAPQSSTGPQYITDIWMSEKVTGNWTTPVKLPSPVNSSSEEWHPSLTNDGTIYFCSKRSGGYLLYKSKKTGDQYLTVEKLPAAINLYGYGAYDPYIAPDESYLIFTSGNSDQYISYRKPDGSWTGAKNLGPNINSDGIEYGSFVSYDSNYYFFSRISTWGLYGYGDLYWVSTSFIDSLKYTNFDPYILNPIPNQNAIVGAEYTYQVPDTIFFDDDGCETLTFSAVLETDAELPSWLSFDTTSKTFTGNPGEPGTIKLKVSVTDTAGARISDVFKLTIMSPEYISNVKGIKLSIYPNPAEDYFVVNSIIPGIKIEYSLVGPDGKILRKGFTETSDPVYISQLTQGVYIVKLRVNGITILKKLLVR